MFSSLRSLKSAALTVSTVALLAGCNTPFDLDLRGGFGQSLDTSAAAQGATADRPQPDNRGIISYPNYQVAVARRGDTLADVAERIGLDAQELAEFNAIKPEDNLRAGEIVALPRRVSEPSETTGGAGQILSPSEVDITSLAGTAIDNATPTVETAPLEAASVPENAQVGFEPIRHTVERGETAFTISRLYNVPVRSLAEWNGLDKDFTIRENQILLIPPAQPSAPSREIPATETVAVTTADTTAPGQGSPTPVPPSAATPLPAETPSEPVAKPVAEDLSKTQTAVKTTKMSYPVSGKVIRAYSKGKNNGIDLSATAGSPVSAAADGTVAAITTDADDVNILVVRHPDNVMTVYYNVENINVSKGTAVKRNQKLAEVPIEDAYLHFEVRKGFDSVDPTPYLN